MLVSRYCIKEKILRQSPVKKLNPYTKQLYWTLRVSLCSDARKKLVNTYRLVYCLFVRKFDLSDPTLVVTCKDDNHLNTFWKNLLLTSKSALQTKTYSEQRKRRPEKAISCYDEKGNLVKTYSSIRAAADQLRCSPSSISLALNGAIAHCKGMYWKSGGRKTIKSKGFAYKHVKRTGQYTLAGKLIQQFFSISEAERLTGFNDIGIRDTAMGRRVSYKGFQWKYL